MKEETFICIGKSGCGKGTQADLLVKVLKEKDPERTTFHLESGQRFREFIAAADTCASQFAKKINEEGELQPEFLAIWIWADILIKHICGNEHLIIDGTPRKLHEASVLETALAFYKRNKPYVVFINVGDQWATERMMDRHRGDDQKQNIEERLNWYAQDVAPVVDYYRLSDKYNFIEVNGEQSVEAVHADIMQKLHI